MLLGRQCVTVNRLIEDLNRAQKIILELEKKVKELEEKNNG
jgi:hypothetical protein